jgi:hypothetical protein
VVEVRLVPPEFDKRNAVVDTSCEVETYPREPRPRVVEVNAVRDAELLRRKAVVDTRDAVET